MVRGLPYARSLNAQSARLSWSVATTELEVLTDRFRLDRGQQLLNRRLHPYLGPSLPCQAVHRTRPHLAVDLEHVKSETLLVLLGGISACECHLMDISKLPDKILP